MITTKKSLKKYCSNKKWKWMTIPKKCFDSSLKRRTGYLIESHRLDSKEENYYIQQNPGRTNMSNQEKLSGWLGNSYGTYSRAHGIVAILGYNRRNILLGIITD